ncbi:MAG TPA: hypothetical protein VFP31_00615 [Gaiellaceae bacterium]|nr:hypothetical protein [Gaiellaceae bacterium]
MRRLLVPTALVALLLPASAPAKLQGQLRICGLSGCRVVDRHIGHDRWPFLEELTGGAQTTPARPGPFYSVTIVPLRGRPGVTSAPAYYVPGARRIRTNATVDWREGVWRELRLPPPALDAAVTALRPYPAPILTRVDVSGLAANAPQTYLRLFRLPSTHQIADPAGQYPAMLDAEGYANTGAIARYWERVRRHWLPIGVRSRRPSPWGDAEASLWIGRRLNLVRRGEEVLRVSPALAARIRRGASLD